MTDPDTAQTEEVPRRRSPPPLAVTGLFVGLAVGWRIVAELGTGVVAFGFMLLAGHSLQDLAQADPMTLIPTWVIAVGSIVQGVGMAGVAFGVAILAGWRVPDVFALRRARVVAWVAAAVGGLTVGLFPGWVAYTVERLAPWLSLGNLDAIATALTSGPLVGQGLMVVAIVIMAPLAEELVFRGFLWGSLERSLPTWVVWLVTSAAFAAYHIDPVHVIAVLFTGLFLGWLRLVSKSVWPGVVAHLMNNLAGTVAAFALPNSNDVVPPWWAAIGFAVFTMALGALAAVGREGSGAVSLAPGEESG